MNANQISPNTNCAKMVSCFETRPYKTLSSTLREIVFKQAKGSFVNLVEAASGDLCRGGLGGSYNIPMILRSIRLQERRQLFPSTDKAPSLLLEVPLPNNTTLPYNAIESLIILLARSSSTASCTPFSYHR